jgi:hypothetical protein
MMLSRIGRDRALRSFPIWGIAAGVNTSVLLGVLAWRAAVRQGGSISTTSLILACWLGVGLYLAFGHVRTRCSGFDLSLPIPTRKLWLAHLLAILIAGGLVVAISVGAITAHLSLLGDRIIFEHSPAVVAALLGAGLVLAALLLQLPRRNLSQIPVSRAYVLWAGLVLAGVPFVLIGAVGLAGSAGAALVLLVAAVVGAWLYVSVPPAYALVPFEPQPADRGVAPDRIDAMNDGRRARLSLPLTILRSLTAGIKEVLAAPFVVLFGMILGGALDSFGSGDLRELRYLYIPMATYMLIAFVGPRLASLRHLDPLPISRQLMSAALLLPYLLMFCVGYGAGAIVATRGASQVEYVNFEESEEGFHVTVPLRVYDVVWADSPPPVESPWGETHEAEPLSPWPVVPATVYSPYSAPPGSSARFVSLQISRAVEAAYGATIAPGEIETRYLTTGEDGSIRPIGQGLTLRADYPDLEVRGGPLFPVLIMLTAVPWLLFAAALLRAYRACIKEWVRQTISWGVLGVLLLFWIGLSVASMFGLMEFWSIRALIQIPVMSLGESAIGTLAAWAVSGLLLAAAYWVAQSQFLRMEIPTTPSKYTLFDRM